MCSQFTILKAQQEIASLFSIKLMMTEDNHKVSQNIFPYTKAPVIFFNGSQQALTLMQFSLIPSWSKESKLKYSTHNARIESITEKPTWKKPFLKSRCLVPVSYFVEPVRMGRYAGNMVKFAPEDGKVLLAAGIYDSWENPADKTILQSFSIITRKASKYIEECGHDRQPVFLKPENIAEWLSAELYEPENILSLIKTSQDKCGFVSEVVRKLKN